MRGGDGTTLRSASEVYNVGFPEQLESIHTIPVEIAALRDLSEIYDRALTYCLGLTNSAMGFRRPAPRRSVAMDVVAMKGFEPPDPNFFERFRTMPVVRASSSASSSSKSGRACRTTSSTIRSGWNPPGHPVVRTFLGVPLGVGAAVIGMVGVANKSPGYGWDDERLLSTFANQVAVAIDNARLYERQREMIVGPATAPAAPGNRRARAAPGPRA